jgi:hypothetical protein
MPVDDEVREEWTREHNELLEQFALPPGRSSNGGPSEGSTRYSGFIKATVEGDGADEIYDADVGR